MDPVCVQSLPVRNGSIIHFRANAGIRVSGRLRILCVLYANADNIVSYYTEGLYSYQGSFIGLLRRGFVKRFIDLYTYRPYTCIHVHIYFNIYRLLYMYTKYRPMPYTFTYGGICMCVGPIHSCLIDTCNKLCYNNASLLCSP